MNDLINKFKEVLASVLPITVIVLILHFTISPLETNMLYAFLIGAVLVVIGLTIFLFGIDQGIEPIGYGVGKSTVHFSSYAVLITVLLILGFFISFAEPDLHILANQVDKVTGGQYNNMMMVVAVSIGIGIMMTIGMIRILKNIPLKYVFTAAYGLIFILCLFSTPEFLAIAFDASGATTGAILGVLITSLFIKDSNLTGALTEPTIASTGLLETYVSKLSHIAIESIINLFPIIVVYIIFQIFVFKQKKSKVLDITRGLILTYIGLVIFLLGVNGGFMDVGLQLGIQLASMESKVPVLLVALLLGLTTVLAEPAVHVLTQQVEDVTGGSVKRNLVLIFLSIAVGLSIFMSALRILLPGIELWMYLLPGFGIAIILSYFIPDLFVGMAFDSGGVASGPMTATFSLAFVQGIAAQIPTADVVTDGFGMIAIVAMMPVIAIGILGALYKIKYRKISNSNTDKSD